MNLQAVGGNGDQHAIVFNSAQDAAAGRLPIDISSILQPTSMNIDAIREDIGIEEIGDDLDLLVQDFVEMKESYQGNLAAFAKNLADLKEGIEELPDSPEKETKLEEVHALLSRVAEAAERLDGVDALDFIEMALGDVDFEQGFQKMLSGIEEQYEGLKEDKVALLASAKEAIPDQVFKLESMPLEKVDIQDTLVKLSKIRMSVTTYKIAVMEGRAKHISEYRATPVQQEEEPLEESASKEEPEHVGHHMDHGDIQSEALIQKLLDGIRANFERAQAESDKAARTQKADVEFRTNLKRTEERLRNLELKQSQILSREILLDILEEENLSDYVDQEMIEKHMDQLVERTETHTFFQGGKLTQEDVKSTKFKSQEMPLFRSIDRRDASDSSTAEQD